MLTSAGESNSGGLMDMRRRDTVFNVSSPVRSAPWPGPPPVSPDELERFLCVRAPEPRERLMIRTWATLVMAQAAVPVLPRGSTKELRGDELAVLQSRTNDAFVGPVFRVDLDEPLLAFRFYGDLCQRVTRLYTSIFTVQRTPGFGDYPRNLLGLTGRNSGNCLTAVRIERGSRIVIGGISNRAAWADQILVEASTDITVVDNLSRFALPGRSDLP